MSYKLAIVVSHPIQHFVPFYRALALSPDIELVVIYASRIGLEPYFDRGMNTMIAWKMDLLGGYESVFLPESDQIHSTAPFDVNNPSVSDELSRQQPDVVLIYGYNLMTSLRALAWCRRRSVPAMMISDSELRTPRSLPIRSIKKLVLPWLLGRFDAFLTVGDCNEDYLRNYGVPDGRFFRSPFTIDENTYLEARKNRALLRGQSRARLGIAEEAVVALTVGKLSPRKRPVDIVETARTFKAAGLPVTPTFVLAGDGTEIDHVRSVAASESLPVLAPGFINVDELPGFYAAADMIVHPSSRDPHPLVMSEAACIGLPLVVSDRVGAVGPTDIARLGQNALQFPCGNISAIVDAVALLTCSPDRRIQMGFASQLIFDQLNIEQSVDGAIKAVRYCAKSDNRNFK